MTHAPIYTFTNLKNNIMELQEKTAEELNLNDKIFFVNNKTKEFSYVLIDGLRNIRGDINIEFGGTNYTAERDEDEFLVGEISNFLNEKDWICAVIPIQEDRCSDIEFKLKAAKCYLNELRAKIAQ